jgi:hypothetical protein
VRPSGPSQQYNIIFYKEWLCSLVIRSKRDYFAQNPMMPPCIGLENMLRNIKTASGNLFHGQLSNVVTFNSHNMTP